MPEQNVSRRSFFQKSVTGLAGAGVFAASLERRPAAPSVFIPKLINQEELKIKSYRPLGNLGFKASDISIGTTGVTDPSYISFALDCGINYIDTAHGYGNGKAERDIAKGLKGRREGIWINTKFARSAWRTSDLEKGLMDSLDESLQRLQVDYVDSIMIHNGKPDQFVKDELHSMFEKAKKAGKVKYLGVSMHDDDAPEMFETVMNDGRFHIILTIYGPFSSQKTSGLFKTAHEKGIAIVAMKTLGAAYNAKIKGSEKLEKRTVMRRDRESEEVDFTPVFMQSAFAWILDNPYVSILVKKMNSIEDIKNSVPASGVKYCADHRKFLEYYASLIEKNYCEIGCGECFRACPNNVAAHKIMRYKMYFENYRSQKEGIFCYKNLPEGQRAIVCSKCTAPCNNACPQGLDVKTELLHAHELLTV